MSTRIKILPENLANKIAAGEVVERPASVVKELLENALDAGCSEVTVEIEGGGKRLIKVSDNGSGMSREDALLALERHATSKIMAEQDLESLTTLGFRGEALPSIASVARFSLATRERQSIEGTEIYAEGGKIREVKACGMAEGTVVTVRNLFFNTPARLKFLKSSDTEGAHVGELVTRLALSRPELRFTYINEGKTVFRALAGGMKERVAALLGNAVAADLYPVELSDGAITVRGLVATPECSRSAASYLYTYINGRFIRDKVVQHAILQAYRNLLERGRYPVVALFIEIPAAEVDVNVHPTKHEVRFREQGRVHDGIRNALESVLRTTPWRKTGTTQSALPQPALQPSSVSAVRVAEVREAIGSYQAPANREQRLTLPAAAESPAVTSDGMVAQPCLRGAAGYFSAMAIIGQYNAAYIVCQDGVDLVLIDQHAAHERVAFERLKVQFAAQGVESQGLLFPDSLELSFREAAAAKEHLAELERCGFVLEDFGGNTWLLKGVPRLLAGADYRRTLRNIIEELLTLGKNRVFTNIVEEVLTRIACHSVVRGSHPLTDQEIRALLAQMDATDFSSNCPHGRPVFHRITLAEVERQFRRG